MIFTFFFFFFSASLLSSVTDAADLAAYWGSVAGIAGSSTGSNLKEAVGTKSEACRSKAGAAGFFFFFLFLLRFLAASAASGPSATSVGVR
jgi:hypothetical protein